MRPTAIRRLAIGVGLAAIAILGVTGPADAKPKPTPPPTVEESPVPDGMTRAELDAARDAAIANAIENGTGVGSSTGGTTTQFETMAVTGWINISSSQGSYNCLIQARQNGSNWWQTRVASGVCKALYVETYRYNSDLMCDLDYYIPAGGATKVPVGYILESRCALKICYIYVYWRDGAGVFRDVVFWDGGSQF